MRLKIISDGLTRTTKVVDADTGEPLEYIKRVTWEAVAGQAHATATIELTDVPVEITAGDGIISIFGVKYSLEIFRHFAQPDPDKLYGFKREGDTVIVEAFSTDLENESV